MTFYYVSNYFLLQISFSDRKLWSAVRWKKIIWEHLDSSSPPNMEFHQQPGSGLWQSISSSTHNIHAPAILDVVTAFALRVLLRKASILWASVPLRRRLLPTGFGWRCTNDPLRMRPSNAPDRAGEVMPSIASKCTAFPFIFVRACVGFQSSTLPTALSYYPQWHLGHFHPSTKAHMYHQMQETQVVCSAPN